MKNILLYNTLTKSLTKYIPKTKKPTIYTCGPTVYNEAHIGNLRAYVFADTLNRSLRNFGYTPKHVINITDVGHLTDDGDDGEDKMEKAAIESNMSAQDIANKYTNQFLSDLKDLGIQESWYMFPRATKYVSKQIEYIKRIESAGFTYTTNDGVYFDTKKYGKYGKLGGIENTEYTRVEHSNEKKNTRDFALWKKTPAGTKRQQEWDSPWGKGFPGWHIECSTMATDILGDEIDIHTGGMDHISIHHNNEIAQTECLTNTDFAKIWMHVSFLTNDGAKFSKSLGNAPTLQELKKQDISPRALRYFFLTASYRSPLSYSIKNVQSAQQALFRLQHEYNKSRSWMPVFPKKSSYTEKIDEAIQDDLNTAKVIAILHDLIHDNNVSTSHKHYVLKYANTIVAILNEKTPKLPEHIQNLIKERNTARKNKDYEKSDKLRDQIKKEGYIVMDTENETIVEKL